MIKNINVLLYKNYIFLLSNFLIFKGNNKCFDEKLWGKIGDSIEEKKLGFFLVMSSDIM